MPRHNVLYYTVLYEGENTRSCEEVKFKCECNERSECDCNHDVCMPRDYHLTCCLLQQTH